MWSVPDGLSDNRVRIVYQDPQAPDTLWLGTMGGGLNRFHDGAFSHLDTGTGLSHNGVRAILRDRAGALWVGTESG